MRIFRAQHCVSLHFCVVSLQSLCHFRGLADTACGGATFSKKTRRCLAVLHFQIKITNNFQREYVPCCFWDIPPRRIIAYLKLNLSWCPVLSCNSSAEERRRSVGASTSWVMGRQEREPGFPVSNPSCQWGKEVYRKNHLPRRELLCFIFLLYLISFNLSLLQLLLLHLWIFINLFPR